MIRVFQVILLIFSACLPSAASAHALDPGFLNLEALGQGRWRVIWRVPDIANGPMALEAQLPRGCTQDTPPPLAFDGRAWTTGWIANCPGGLAGGVIRIEGLEATNTDTLVRYEMEPGKTQIHRLTPSETVFTVPSDAGAAEVLTSYVSLGVKHILEGVDHLLFVLALILLIRDRRRLFWAVTAFTVAHSITLAAASLGWVNLPPPPVEASIALSIVFLAYELTLPPERRDPLTERFPWLLSFAFGLVHGLGFAGALREIGLPQSDVPLALFGFNVGVELGQLLFIGFVLLLGYLVRQIVPAISAQSAKLSLAASYAIGGIAAFWVIERLSAF